ncbi:MAG: LysR family transcriptional regulator [Alphaproteobacteria bacterium]|nr:LysR family transcriptional regulator [Alphaproteobacteria bacterium]
MDWDKLRTFKVVAEAGSFTQAGSTLNLSQSAISRQILSLEQSIGQLLFHRHARGLILTEQGELLYQTAKDIFERIEKVATQLSDSRALPEGPLTITTVEFIASTWLAPRLGSFKNAYPQIEFTMLVDDRIYDLSKREADAAIRLQRGDHSDLIEWKINTLEFSLCASKIYLEKNGIPDQKRHFKNHTMIGFPQDTYTPFLKPNKIFQLLDIDIENNPNIIFVNSMDVRYAAVKKSLGISVLPRYIIEQQEDLVTLMPEIEIPGVDMFFVYPQERKNSKRISVFKDFLMENMHHNDRNYA